jgi:hypothetical protein
VLELEQRRKGERARYNTVTGFGVRGQKGDEDAVRYRIEFKRVRALRGGEVRWTVRRDEQDERRGSRACDAVSDQLIQIFIFPIYPALLHTRIITLHAPLGAILAIIARISVVVIMSHDSGSDSERLP